MRVALQNVWRLLKETVGEFFQDSAMSQAASLAFYTALGLAPIVVLALTIMVVLGEDAKQALIDQVHGMVGSQAAEGLDEIIESADDKPGAGAFAAALGLATVLFSASGIFAQLQSTLNHIWNVKAKPNAEIWSWLRARLLSMGLLLSTLFLLLVSLVLSATISLLMSGDGIVWSAVNLAFSILLFTSLFAMIFKFLPDVEIAWRDVAVGAAVTAILFAIGKYLIGLYLGNSSVASSYGAAGSLVALLIWVYYSAVIMLLGAEITQVYARRYGAELRPSEHAMPAVS